MHIHLGNDISVAAENVIGIFDIENSSANKDTRNFLRKAEKIGTVVTVSYDMPKSFVVCTDKDNKEIVYISCISASVLRKRAGMRIGGFEYGCKPE